MSRKKTRSSGKKSLLRAVYSRDMKLKVLLLLLGAAGMSSAWQSVRSEGRTEREDAPIAFSKENKRNSRSALRPATEDRRSTGTSTSGDEADGGGSDSITVLTLEGTP